jgi:hypothetical protein
MGKNKYFLKIGRDYDIFFTAIKDLPDSLRTILQFGELLLIFGIKNAVI